MADVKPRVFFLNERQETTGDERKSGGRPPPEFEVADWRAKADGLAQGFSAVRESAKRYPRDPTAGHRFFLAAAPVQELVSESKAKDAKDGKKTRAADFRDEDAAVLLKLGFDILDIDADGRAMCHLDEARIGALERQLAVLDKSGRGEKARWARLEALTPTVLADRVDLEWLGGLPREETVEFMAKLPALLSRAEAEDVQRVILTMMELKRGDRLIETGLDYSGRAWMVGRARVGRIETMGAELASIQAIFEPVRLEAASAGVMSIAGQPGQQPGGGALPVVAVVDHGIPRAHRSLKRSIRVAFGSPTHVDDHGSFVAGVVVNGYVPPGSQPTRWDCEVVDVNIASPVGNPRQGPLVERVIEAMTNVVNAAPDVRVFNLSWGTPLSLPKMTTRQRLEALRLTADLDGFASENDVVVVLAAGNSAPGLLPAEDYPNHAKDPNWAYGALAPAANAITVGAFADEFHILGDQSIPSSPGWPSPFCRVGELPIKVTKPDFSAPGGAWDFAMKPKSGTSTWTATGRLEVVAGTSVAAPIIAREAARAMSRLEAACPPAVRPFAATVRAALILGAEPPERPPKPKLKPLFDKTLGLGLASAEPLVSPSAARAWFVWQGELEGPGEITRVRVPVPYDWLVAAGSPSARVVWAWDSPVNTNDVSWTCRTVKCELRASVDSEGRYLIGTKGRVAAGTAWRTMEFSLALGAKQSSLKDKDNNRTEEDLVLWPEDGLWQLSLWYEEAAALPDNPRRTYSTRQRVGLALELRDDDGVESPQAHVQAHELSAVLDRLAFPLQTPNTLVVPNRPR